MMTGRDCPDCGKAPLVLFFDGYQTYIQCKDCSFDALYGEGNQTMTSIQDDIKAVRKTLEALDGVPELHLSRKLDPAINRILTELEALQVEKKELVKALHFYGDRENNTPTGNLCEESGPVWTAPSAVSWDNGDIARDVLSRVRAV